MLKVRYYILRCSLYKADYIYQIFHNILFSPWTLGEALVPEAAAGMEKGSASIIIEQKIFYICRWKCSDSLSHSQIRRLLSCLIFKKVSPPSDLVGSILRFSLKKEFSNFHTCFLRLKSPKTLATIGTLYNTSTMEKRWRWRIFVFNDSIISKSGQAEYRRRRIL